jgi:tail fiber protein gp32
MSITSANAILNLSVQIIFPNPVQIQGFATDDVYGVGGIKKNETRMGVDGFLSGGKVWQPVPVTYHLQPDSASCAFFDTWAQQEDAIGDTLVATGNIVLTGLGKRFQLVRGILGTVSPAPEAGVVLKTRSWEVTWNRIIPAQA